MPPRAAAAPHGFPCWQVMQMCQGTSSSCCCVPAVSHQLTPMAPHTGALTNGPHMDTETERTFPGAHLGLKQLHFLCAVTSCGPHSLHHAQGDTHRPLPQPRKPEESLAESPGLETHPARSTAASCSSAGGSALLPTQPGCPSLHCICPNRRLLSRREGTQGFQRLA